MMNATSWLGTSMLVLLATFWFKRRLERKNSLTAADSEESIKGKKDAPEKRMFSRGSISRSSVASSASSASGSRRESELAQGCSAGDGAAAGSAGGGAADGALP